MSARRARGARVDDSQVNEVHVTAAADSGPRVDVAVRRRGEDTA
jgi:hypothetical protein